MKLKFECQFELFRCYQQRSENSATFFALMYRIFANFDIQNTVLIKVFKRWIFKTTHRNPLNLCESNVLSYKKNPNENREFDTNFHLPGCL